MRTTLILVPLLLGASPALAQSAPPPQPQQVLLPDPATVDRLANTMQALTKSFLDLPVGNVRAALEGRQPTSADRHRTVGTETGLNARDLDARIAATRPQIDQSIKAMNEALPEITRSLVEAQKSVERAIANMPDPNYPRR